jgi:hypothetical protein
MEGFLPIENTLDNDESEDLSFLYWQRYDRGGETDIALHFEGVTKYYFGGELGDNLELQGSYDLYGKSVSSIILEKLGETYVNPLNDDYTAYLDERSRNIVGNINSLLEKWEEYSKYLETAEKHNRGEGCVLGLIDTCDPEKYKQEAHTVLESIWEDDYFALSSHLYQNGTNPDLIVYWDSLEDDSRVISSLVYTSHSANSPYQGEVVVLKFLEGLDWEGYAGREQYNTLLDIVDSLRPAGEVRGFDYYNIPYAIDANIFSYNHPDGGLRQERIYTGDNPYYQADWSIEEVKEGLFWSTTRERFFVGVDRDLHKGRGNSYILNSASDGLNAFWKVDSKENANSSLLVYDKAYLDREHPDMGAILYNLGINYNNEKSKFYGPHQDDTRDWFVAFLTNDGNLQVDLREADLKNPTSATNKLDLALHQIAEDIRGLPISYSDIENEYSTGSWWLGNREVIGYNIFGVKKNMYDRNIENDALLFVKLYGYDTKDPVDYDATEIIPGLIDHKQDQDGERARVYLSEKFQDNNYKGKFYSRWGWGFYNPRPFFYQDSENGFQTFVDIYDHHYRKDGEAERNGFMTRLKEAYKNFKIGGTSY